MRRIKSGVVIDKFNLKVCHNPKCPIKGRINPKTVPVLCKQCNYMEYCSTQCKEKHWNISHKLVCKEITKINFIESLVLTCRCPRNGEHGLHNHPKIINEKITYTRKQINAQAANLTNTETHLSCQCNSKVGNRKDISPTVMLEEIQCMNQFIVHVYIRCNNYKCNQRKNAQPLFDLCPLSLSHKILVVIPFQKDKPAALDYINNDSEHIEETPEECDYTAIEVNLIKNCPKCIKTHVSFRLVTKKTKENQNDNSNIHYVFNDNKDKWEFLIYS